MTEKPDLARTVGGAGTIDSRRATCGKWETYDPGKVYRALVVIEEDEDGVFVVHSPSLPGAASQGRTPEEALENIREALAGCIEAYLEDDGQIPWVHNPGFDGKAVEVDRSRCLSFPPLQVGRRSAPSRKPGLPSREFVDRTIS